MKIISIIFFIFCFSLDLAGSPVTQPVIVDDLLDLKNNLVDAQSKLGQLKKQKARLDQDLKNLLDWAIAQEKEKIDAYSKIVELESNLILEQQKVVAEKAQHQKTLDKYHRVKSILGYLAGAVLFLLYTRISITSISTLLPGPWGFILHILGPAGAFSLGYFLVKIYF